MKLYYFTKKNHAIDSLTNKTLKIATIDTLNDPYEFFVTFKNGDKQLEGSTIDTMKENYSKVMGFLCFSSKNYDPVQWAHYADNHCGMCMEFDISDALPVKIKYQNNPIEIDISNRKWKDLFIESTITKYQHWSYEREFRVSIKLKDKAVKEVNGLYFIPYSDELILRKLYAGVRCQCYPRKVDIIYS